MDTKYEVNLYKNNYAYFPVKLAKALGIYKKKADILLSQINGEICVKVKKVY